MITKDKVTEIFCIIDEFCKHFDEENAKSKKLLKQRIHYKRTFYIEIIKMNIPKSPLIRHSKEYLIRGLFLFIYI